MWQWGVWINLAFAVAPDSAQADVIIRFTTATSTADAQASQWVGNTLTQCLIRINPNYQNWSTPEGQAAFSFIILHEGGHCLGAGDLYMTDHGNGHTFEGEDFCDHGLPSGAVPDPRVKEDNVMNTFGVTVLDNDEIYAAEWLWGNLGSDAITTGALQTRIVGENANEAASHHGPITWTYRGTVWGTSPTIVEVNFNNIHGARSIGWGSWTVQIFPFWVEWRTGAYRGNFIFQIDDSQPENPERLGDAMAAGRTNFTATPAGGGQQHYPFPQIFGIDCYPYTPCDTTILPDSVTVVLDTCNTNVEIRFRAPVAGEYTVWSTSDKNAVFPTNFIPEDTLTASPGLNMWTDPSALAPYKLYTVTHTCP